jgi:hypothetical protein
LGLILAALTVIAYAIDLSLFTKWWFGIIMLLLVIVFGIISSVNAKKLLEGIISFKQVFTSYFITILVGTLISSVVSIIIFNIIDPESAIILQDMLIENQAVMLEKFGAPQESIDQVTEEMRSAGSSFSIVNILQSIAFQLIGYSIVGLIVAAATKQKDPHAA